ncbi:ABC transporter substrate-binding protein [Streptomyces sp. SBT349]|uniref:ABC transporter substrate-binding protein n=1 Tax=Streptomyces sp. SBT349 TaxID=1580539 RepID=UPI0007C659E6|nr:ABC transporter substrate-binding protein [Streptomyces sp. SBT349]
MANNGEEQGGLPAYPGMGAFVDALQELIRQPRRRRGWLPVVLLRDPEGGSAECARLGPALRDWLGGQDAPLARHAYLERVPEGAGSLAPFTALDRQLKETSRRCGEGRLRLPALWLLMTVARARPELRTDHLRPRALRDHCYAEFRTTSMLARILWDLGGHARESDGGGNVLGLIWHALSAWLFQWLPRWWFGVVMRRRLRWFTRWGKDQLGRAQQGPFSLFAYAQELVPGETEADGAQERQKALYRVLAQALLQDLEQAVARRPLNPWRRRRRNRFVLLFVGVGDKDSREQQLVRELRTWAGRRGCTSALVVATGVTSLAERVQDLTVPDFTGAATALRDSMRRAPEASGMVVRVPAGPAADESARYELGLRPRLVVPVPRYGPATELAGGMAGAALACAGIAAAAVLGPLPLGEDDPCRGSTFLGADGSCVGVQDTQVVKNAKVRDVLDQIERENADIEEATADWSGDDPRPLPRTVVYVGTLSGAEHELDPVLGGTLAELRGILLAQRLTNDQALEGEERVPLRLVVADAGQRFQDAPEVAHSIVELAERDPSIVGVIGMGQSRDTTYAALETLSTAGLPVIGTSGTADELLEHGNHYYQIAPTNSRAGAAMAEFAANAEMVTVEEGSVRARQSLLVVDPDDSYSSSLGLAFTNGYSAERTRTLLYSPVDGNPDDDVPPIEGESQASLQNLAREVCSELSREPRTAVVWTARGSEIVPFLDEMDRLSRQCPRLTMLGGDEVTNVRISESHPWDAFDRLSLYFVVGGAGPLLEKIAGTEEVSVEGRDFYQAYHSAYDETDDAVTRALASDAHPALAWDALRYLSSAVDQAWVTTGLSNRRLDRDLVQGVLYQGLGDGGFEGATGWIDSSGVENDRRTGDKLIVIVRANREAPTEEVMACGILTRDDNRQRWGENEEFPCPAPDRP